MKKYIGILLLSATMSVAAQTLTVRNETGILLSDVIFKNCKKEEKTVSFYGNYTVKIPEEAVEFKVITPAAYRNGSTGKHDVQLATTWVPIMTTMDIMVKVTLDGDRSKAEASCLRLEQIN
ncbi:MAG: hypothetical protein WD068_02405 [Candidatus Babeliales bacterium]